MSILLVLNGLRAMAFGASVGFAVLAGAESASAYSANKVWFEFRPGGVFRVVVNYTVPEMKEFRESYVEFTNRKAAERFYWDLVRGADFYPPDPEARRFVSSPLTPEAW